MEWLTCYAPDGTARFLGLQLVTGSIGDRTGSFVVEAVGNHDGKRSKGTWAVIEGSGTGELSGLRGGGTFQAPGGLKASYSIDYRFG